MLTDKATLDAKLQVDNGRSRVGFCMHERLIASAFGGLDELKAKLTLSPTAIEKSRRRRAQDRRAAAGRG